MAYHPWPLVGQGFTQYILFFPLDGTGRRLIRRLIPTRWRLIPNKPGQPQYNGIWNDSANSSNEVILLGIGVQKPEGEKKSGDPDEERNVQNEVS